VHKYKQDRNQLSQFASAAKADISERERFFTEGGMFGHDELLVLSRLSRPTNLDLFPDQGAASFWLAAQACSLLEAHPMSNRNPFSAYQKR
jgi:hypothetical protein